MALTPTRSRVIIRKKSSELLPHIRTRTTSSTPPNTTSAVWLQRLHGEGGGRCCTVRAKLYTANEMCWSITRMHDTQAPAFAVRQVIERPRPDDRRGSQPVVSKYSSPCLTACGRVPVALPGLPVIYIDDTSKC